MKIGILTFHREENFGASLQAYALLCFLKQNGYEVNIIDYDPIYRRMNRRMISPILFKRASFKDKIKMLVRVVLNFKSVLYIKKIFHKFQRDFLNISNNDVLIDIKLAKEKYDIVISGSDQIWQPFIANYGNFDSAYFFAYPMTKKHISYGASMGNLNMLTDQNKDVFRDYLSKVDSINVREYDLYKYIRNLGFNVNQVCDPVFLMTRSFWITFANLSTVKIPRHYVLVHRANTNLVDNVTNYVLEQYNCPILYINKKGKIRNSMVVNISSLSDIINIILNADFVITSSFHVTAFCLIFNKKFVTFNKNPERAISITKALGVRERCIEKYDKNILHDIIKDDKNINYENNEFIIRSREILLNEINKNNE